MKPQPMTLDSEIFNEFRGMLDAAIRSTLNQMTDREIKGGKICATIDIKMASSVDNDTGEIVYTPQLEPKININIGSKDDYKMLKQYGFIMKDDGKGGYVIGTNQIDMNELLDNQKGA